jgi:hypothetical protein
VGKTDLSQQIYAWVVVSRRSHNSSEIQHSGEMECVDAKTLEVPKSRVNGPDQKRHVHQKRHSKVIRCDVHQKEILVWEFGVWE